MQLALDNQKTGEPGQLIPGLIKRAVVVGVLLLSQGWRIGSIAIGQDPNGLPENVGCGPKQHPDRRNAEGDKPSKRQPDQCIISAHDRFCQILIAAKCGGDGTDALPETATSILVIAGQ
jgi:hypothetical protein